MLENQELQEGINDTAIFKAVFLAGGPGSGKSFIGTEKKGKSPTVGADPKQFMGGGQLGLINLGLRVVNPDPAYEKLLKSAGLDPKSSDDIWSDEGQEIRVKASELTAKQKAHYVKERLGIIIDGTGKDVNKIIGQKKLLDDAGYETAMIYVNTNLETAIARDAKRDRTLGANAVTKMWDAVQKNVKKYKSIFGSSMYIIDNSDGSNWFGESQKAHKKIEKWVRKSPSSPKAKAWIANKDRMRNEPKGGIREEDSHYLPGYTTGFYGYDPETSRSKIQDLHHNIRRSSSINDACNEVSEKWHTKLAELSKLNATHLDDLDDEDIEKLLPIAIKMRKEQMSLEEGFLDTFLGKNMKKGNVDKKKSKKSKNSEQVKLSTEIDRKLRLIDDLMKKVRPLGGNLGRLMAFRKLPIDKMTPKGMYVALNDWWDSVEADLDDDSEDDNEKYAQSAEKLYDLWEEVGFKLSDYMWASGYNVKGIGQMAKIGFPAKKRTDPEWLKMNESVDLDESVYDKKLAQTWKKVKSVPNVRGISNSGQNHAKKLSALLKGSPDNLTFEKLELALGTYETHAYKAAEDKKNPHGKEDLAKLEEFSNSVDNVIGAMKNLHQSQLPEGFLDTMKQLVPGARNPQKPREGKKTAMQMQFPYARLSVHRMIVALRKARGTAMKGKAQGKDRRENERSLGYILAHVEDIARNRHTEQPNTGRQIHDTGNIDDATQQYFMDKIAQNDWTKTDQEILNAMVGNGTDDYTKGGAYFKNLAHDIALSVKYAKKDAGIKESVELDEAKSQGMFVVLEKGSKNKVIGQFKDKSKAVDMMKKNAGSKVIRIGKFATDDDKPVDIKVGDELSYTRVKLATKVKESMYERSLTKGEEKKKEKYVKGMKKNKDDFKNRYGRDAEKVMYGTATKIAKNESTELNELSPKTKKSYKNKATRSIGNEKKYSDSYSDASKADPDNPTYKSRADQHKRKLKNRMAGVKQADESTLGELSMTKADLTKTGMRVDSKKMAELKKELMKLKKGLKVKMEQYIAESVYFEDETMEMVARDLMIMQNKILDLVEIMDDDGMGGVDSQPISLEPWVVAKITKAKDYLDSIHDYTVMDNENE